MVNIQNVKEINNARFSKEKTDELLANLKDSGAIVGVEDLASYIRKSGLIVKEHIGRKRVKFEMNPKFYGINLSERGDSTIEFHKDYVESGKISFIPKTIEKKLQAIEGRVRMARKRASIGYDSTFIPVETYDRFKVDFEKAKSDYFNTCEQIVTSWEALLDTFKEKLEDSLSDFNSVDRASIFSGIMSRVPTKFEYKNSFYMNLTIKAFPVTENLDMFKDEIRDQIEKGLTDETVATMYEIIGNTLNQAFETVLKTIESHNNNGEVSIKTKGSVKRVAGLISEKNIFANPIINDVKVMMLEMLRTPDVSVAGEQILGAIYGYSKELNVLNLIDITNCHLSDDELMMYYEEFQENMAHSSQPLAKAE